MGMIIPCGVIRMRDGSLHWTYSRWWPLTLLERRDATLLVKRTCLSPTQRKTKMKAKGHLELTSHGQKSHTRSGKCLDLICPCLVLSLGVYMIRWVIKGKRQSTIVRGSFTRMDLKEVTSFPYFHLSLKVWKLLPMRGPGRWPPKSCLSEAWKTELVL